MKRIVLLLSLTIIVVMGIPAFAQETENASDTKTLLVEKYQKMVLDIFASIQLEKTNIDSLKNAKIDALVRDCVKADIERILDAIENNINAGSFDKSPTLSFTALANGKFPFEKKTMKAYTSDIQGILNMALIKAKRQTIWEYIAQDKMAFAKTKAELLKELNKDLKALLKLKVK